MKIPYAYESKNNFTKYGLRSIEYTQPKVTHTRRTHGLAFLLAQDIEANIIIASVNYAIYECHNISALMTG